jgi:hypothetical protein
MSLFRPLLALVASLSILGFLTTDPPPLFSKSPAPGPEKRWAEVLELQKGFYLDENLTLLPLY